MSKLSLNPFLLGAQWRFGPHDFQGLFLPAANPPEDELAVSGFRYLGFRKCTTPFTFIFLIFCGYCSGLFAAPWTVARQAPLSSISRSLLKFMSFELVMLSNHFLCPWEFPGRNTGVGCQFSSRGSSRSRNRIHICIACIVRRILYH